MVRAWPGSPTGRAGGGQPAARVRGRLQRLCAVYKRLSSARWGCHVPQTPGNAPKSPGTAAGALGSGREQELVCPLPLPLCRRGWRGACWGRACVPGFRSGIRSACPAWGAQAWACSLCSPAASSSPARLPRRARSAAQGPVPTRSLPPECPGLLSAQTRQGPPGPSVLSVSVTPPLPAPLRPPRPRFGLTSAHLAAPQIPMHRGTGHLCVHCLQPLIPQPQGQWRPAQPMGAGPAGSPSRSHSC